MFDSAYLVIRSHNSDDYLSAIWSCDPCSIIGIDRLSGNVVLSLGGVEFTPPNDSQFLDVLSDACGDRDDLVTFLRRCDDDKADT